MLIFQTLCQYWLLSLFKSPIVFADCPSTCVYLHSFGHSEVELFSMGVIGHLCFFDVCAGLCSSVIGLFIFFKDISPALSLRQMFSSIYYQSLQSPPHYPLFS